MRYFSLAIVLLVTLGSPLYAHATDYSAVDNTSRNVRDRNANNPTAQNQSNEKPFVQTAARLRREIIRTKGLSVDAQNIKIIDQNGYVVLRGPVSNDNEKRIIDELARKCCGTNVNDELEVKNK